MKKRIVSLLLAMVLVLGMVPATVSAAEVVASGQWCPGINCTRYADGTLEFTGTGVLTGTEKFWPEVYNATRLVIGNGITAIDDTFNTFSVDVVSIEIADSVQSIGDGVFTGYSKLTTVKLGSGVKSIGERCFQDCTSLTDVDLGTSLETIGDMAFYSAGIKKITLPESVTQIGRSAFADSALESVAIPAGVQTFGEYVFLNCASLTSATIASSVVPVQAFENCKNLTSVTLLDTVTKIEFSAFGRSGLKSIEIPGSVKEIGERAFQECLSLKDVIIHNGVEVVGSCSFAICEALETITLPASVKKVEDGAFSSCPELKTAIFTNPATEFADNVFDGCHEDLSITLGGNVGIHSFGPYGDNITWTYYYDGRMVFSGTGELKGVHGAFSNVFDQPWKENPTKVVIESGISAIAENVFYHVSTINIVSVEIAGSVKTIGANAFADNKNLKDVILHEGIEEIGDSAFGRLPLEKIVIPDSVHTIGGAAFNDCENMTEAYFGKGLKKLGYCVFCGNPMTVIVFEGDAPECEPGDLGTGGLPPVIYYDRNNPTWTDEYIQSHVYFSCDPINFAACDVNRAGELVPYIPTQDEAWEMILGLKPEYPEGMTWGEEQLYIWAANGDVGAACSAFAMQISDRVFGAVPAKEVYMDLKMEDLRVGDILCFRNSPTTTHAVLILEVHEDHVVIAEGNYGGKVRWGSTMSREEVEAAYCYYTRYYEKPVYIAPEISDSTAAEGPEFTTTASVVNRDDYDVDTVDWVYYDDGTVVISGTGEIPGHYYWESPWQEAKRVVIMSGITKIDNRAFQGMDTLESVHIAGTVKIIGEGAFFECESLKEIVLYEGIEHIQRIAFAYSMAEVPDGIRIVIPDSVKSIGEEAFKGCKSLTEVVLGIELERIESQPFVNCKIRKITFRGDAPTAGLNAFMTSACFEAGMAEIYYPLGNPTWTERFMNAHSNQYVGTNIVWVGYYPDGQEQVQPPSVPLFTDVPQNKYYAAPVAWAVEMGITNGKTATEFCPDEICTRGQVMTFIWRANGCPEPTSMEHNFTDLNPKKFYYKAVLWAVEQGITTGKTATTFEPDSACTRSQVVTFLWRVAGQPEPNNMNNPFNDVQSNAYYYKAVLWAVEEGITTGKTATTFQPKADCIRAQIVTFLYRDMVE